MLLESAACAQTNAPFRCGHLRGPSIPAPGGSAAQTASLTRVDCRAPSLRRHTPQRNLCRTMQHRRAAAALPLLLLLLPDEAAGAGAGVTLADRSLSSKDKGSEKRN